MKIGYARVSTHEQNLDAQLDALQRADCDKIVQEQVSTRKESRPKFNELLSWLRPGDVLVCTKMDRIARSMRELLSCLDDLNARSIDVVFLDQQLDTTQAGGKLLLHLLAAFAEFERDLIRERTLAGLAAARARGRKGGRRCILRGSKLTTAFNLYDTREYTVRQICESLDIRERTLYEYLKRRKEAISTERRRHEESGDSQTADC